MRSASGTEPERSLTRLLRVLGEHLVGDTAPNPVPASFIWPSDHAGVVATLAIGTRSHDDIRSEDHG